MPVHIVTDGSAGAALARLAVDASVTVVPNRLHLAGFAYREGVDLDYGKVLRHMQHQPTPPPVEAPGTADFLSAFQAASHNGDAVLALLPARAESLSWANARAAAEQLRGSVTIEVIDSGLVCAGLALLVRAAAQLQATALPFDELASAVRAVAERTYGLYYAHNVDYLTHAGLLSPAHGMMAAMHRTYPLLAVEAGVLAPTEKVASVGAAIEHFVNFVAEFDAAEHLLVVQPFAYPDEAARTLHTRLAQTLPGARLSYVPLAPTLAARIGPDALGLVLQEPLNPI